jgi:hypothetical protein
MLQREERWQRLNGAFIPPDSRLDSPRTPK